MSQKNLAGLTVTPVENTQIPAENSHSGSAAAVSRLMTWESTKCATVRKKQQLTFTTVSLKIHPDVAGVAL